jgi:hypothetical protein
MSSSSQRHAGRGLPEYALTSSSLANGEWDDIPDLAHRLRRLRHQPEAE